MKTLKDAAYCFIYAIVTGLVLVGVVSLAEKLDGYTLKLNPKEWECYMWSNGSDEVYLGSDGRRSHRATDVCQVWRAKDLHKEKK